VSIVLCADAIAVMKFNVQVCTFARNDISCCVIKLDTSTTCWRSVRAKSSALQLLHCEHICDIIRDYDVIIYMILPDVTQ